MHLGDIAQISGLGGKYFCPLSHLSGYTESFLVFSMFVLSKNYQFILHDTWDRSLIACKFDFMFILYLIHDIILYICLLYIKLYVFSENVKKSEEISYFLFVL